MEGTPLLDLATINQDDQNSKQVWKKRICWCIGIVAILFILLIGIGALVLQFSYLPDRVQNSLDNSQMIVKSSLLTQPLITTFHLVSDVTTNAKPPYPATISSATYTFRFCAPNTSYSFLPYNPNCTYSSDLSIIGHCPGPEFDVNTDGSSSIHFDSTFTITNLSNFQLFSSYLFVLESVDWHIEATFDVTVTVVGIPFTVKDVKLNHLSPCSGLNGLPGVYTEYLDFSYNSSVSEVMPIINTTTHLYNQGTTSFVPLGDLRYEYLINFNFTHDHIPPFAINLSNYEHFATVMSPNTSVFSGYSSVFAYGPVDSRILKNGGWNLLIQNYFNGIPSPIVGWNTHNWDPCCNYSSPLSSSSLLSSPFDQQEREEQNNTKLLFWDGVLDDPFPPIPNTTDCVCTPASSIPLYDAFLQGLILFIEFTPAPSSNYLFVEMFIDSTRLRPGGTQQLSVQMRNPFGAPLSFAHWNISIIYQNYVMATYDVTGTPIIQLKPYEKNTIKPLGLAHFESYDDGTAENKAMNEFMALLKTGSNVIGSLLGSIQFFIVGAQTDIDLQQKKIDILPAASLEDVYIQ